MKRRGIYLGIVFCLFLAGCGKRFKQITDLLGKYLGPGYHERIAQEKAKSSPSASSDDLITEEDEKKEIEIAKDVDIAPWTTQDGVIPKGIIGELQVKRRAWRFISMGALLP